MRSATDEEIGRAERALGEATASYEKAKATGDQSQIESAKKVVERLFGELAGLKGKTSVNR